MQLLHATMLPSVWWPLYTLYIVHVKFVYVCTVHVHIQPKVTVSCPCGEAYRRGRQIPNAFTTTLSQQNRDPSTGLHCALKERQVM